MVNTSNKIIQLKQKDIPALRKKILQEQGGVCAICGKVPDVPCLDHDHKKRTDGTGLIRGCLCSTCNIFLAKSENNCKRYRIKRKELPNILRKMAIYLEKEQYPYIHPSEVPKPKKVKMSCFKELRKEYLKKYPKRKSFKIPKRRQLTEKWEKLFKELNVKVEYVKN